MRVLVLGCGMQGRAVLYDLVRAPAVRAVTCADVAVGRVQTYAAELGSEKLGRLYCYVDQAKYRAENQFATLPESRFGGPRRPRSGNRR